MLQFRGSAISSYAGLLPYSELDDAFGLTDTGGDTLADTRTGKNIRHLLRGLLCQSVFGRLASYEDVNDANRLCRDPANALGGGRPSNHRVTASASQMGRFEKVAESTREPCRSHRSARPVDRQGAHAATAENRLARHGFERDPDLARAGRQRLQRALRLHCYHPLFVFNQLGDVERCAPRSGNVHSADGWRAVLEPMVARYRGTVKRLYFRGDAVFANPGMYEFLEAEGIGFTIRLPANNVLQGRSGYLLKRPVGRPPHEVRRYVASFSYQAQSWNKPRRVVAKVEWHLGELYPRVGLPAVGSSRLVAGRMSGANSSTFMPPPAHPSPKKRSIALAAIPAKEGLLGSCRI
jgi:hypothetical protein